MMASSDARWRVSSTRRTFSSATLKLAAIVERSWTSDSVKASSWSRFCSEMTPPGRPPTGSGTKSAALAGSPLSAPGWPSACTAAVASRLMSSGWPVSRTWRRAPMTGMFSLGKRTPRSMVYSKRISPASRSSIAMSTTWASKMAWILSPTSSYMAPISSLLARPSWTPLMMASSAARWSVSASRRFVSAKRRAFSRATPMLETIVVRTRSSLSV